MNAANHKTLSVQQTLRVYIKRHSNTYNYMTLI